MNNKLLLVDRLERDPEVGKYEIDWKALNIVRDGGFEGNLIVRQKDGKMKKNSCDVFEQGPWVEI